MCCLSTAPTSCATTAATSLPGQPWAYWTPRSVPYSRFEASQPACYKIAGASSYTSMQPLNMRRCMSSSTAVSTSTGVCVVCGEGAGQRK